MDGDCDILDREPRHIITLPHHSVTATMGRVKTCRSDKAHEKSVRLAKQYLINGTELSIRFAARTYNIPYSTLRDRLQTRTGARRDPSYSVYRKLKL